MAKVAIFGASGIGRHHAAWWKAAGAPVCAILGRTAPTANESASRLSESLGHSVAAFHNLDDLLHAAKPDIVDVCTPDAWHGAHVCAALEAGCSVLCEKPFLSDPSRTRHELLAEAASLVDLAASKGVRLGGCTQYAVVAESLRTLAGPQPGRRFEGHIASPAGRRPPDPASTWCDLGPHLLSMLTRIHPALAPDWATLRAIALEDGAHITFDATTPHGQLACSLRATRRTTPPLHIRHFQLDDWGCNIAPALGADGLFAVRLETETGSHEAEDGMRVLIRRFLAGDLVAPPATLLHELDLLLRIRDLLPPL